MMQIKKIFIMLAILLIFFLIPLGKINAEEITPLKSERIESFEITQIFQLDGSIIVEEKITFYSFGLNIQNGLVRTFPKKIIDDKGEENSFILSGFSLKLEEIKEKFLVQEDSKYIYVYMGDSNKKLNNGKHIFIFNYKIKNLIIPFSIGYDKYFFSPTGVWELPIEKVTIKIIIPIGKNLTLLQTEMFKENSEGISFSKTDFYSIKDKIKGELTIIPKGVESIGTNLFLSILVPRKFFAIDRTDFNLKYFGFYIFLIIIFLFSIYGVLNKSNKKKWFVGIRILILLGDILLLILIFNKNNGDIILWLFTIFLVLAMEIGLTAINKGINKNFVFFKYVIVVASALFYCVALLNFAYRMQGLFLLFLIILQVFFLNKRKEAFL
jgi:hypothetical protein